MNVILPPHVLNQWTLYSALKIQQADLSVCWFDQRNSFKSKEVLTLRAADAVSSHFDYDVELSLAETFRTFRLVIPARYLGIKGVFFFGVWPFVTANTEVMTGTGSCLGCSTTLIICVNEVSFINRFKIGIVDTSLWVKWNSELWDVPL